MIIKIFKKGLGKTFYKKFFPISLTFLLAGCAAVGYKSIPVGKNSPGIDAIILSIYTVKTETVFKKLALSRANGADGSEETVEASGMALAIAPDLLLALDHVVSDYELSYSTPFGKVVVPAEKLREQTYLKRCSTETQNINHRDTETQRRSLLSVSLPPCLSDDVGAIHELPLQALIRDRDSDVALFKVGAIHELPLQPLPIPFGRSSDLRVGDIVYVIGNAFHLGLNARQGIVSALKAPARVKTANINPDNAFMLSNGLVPGDSGGPVLAIRNGYFEIVGLAQGMIAAAPNLGMALKIEAILERIKEFRGEPFINGSPQTPFENF